MLWQSGMLGRAVRRLWRCYHDLPRRVKRGMVTAQLLMTRVLSAEHCDLCGGRVIEVERLWLITESDGRWHRLPVQTRLPCHCPWVRAISHADPIGQLVSDS
ncbi:hypothetical protein [Thermogemmatispora sp.]|uniref:hypothetical protein n=1 Tax=Thermogemmatispora sp. TaxID=1968838 RepID=UPI0035E4589B